MKKETIAVIGAGMAGIEAALELSKSGFFDVTLLEKDDELGGLSACYRWRDIVCDRFYHVILSSDRHLIELVRDLKLESDLVWTSVKSGFFGEEKLVSLSSISDFFRFPFLSFFEKIKMGLGILYSAQLKNSFKLENTLAKDWLIRIFGYRAYESVWEPLLFSKLGAARNQAPATFIWSTIRRLYGARSLISKRERMGYVRGGYCEVLKAAKQRLADLNVRILTSNPVQKVISDPNGGIIVVSSLERRNYNRVLLTIPSPDVYRILDGQLPGSRLLYLRDTRYLGVICLLLILNRPLSPYYVINLLDKTLPFTAIVESTKVILSEELANCHLVYLPKYVFEDDELIKQSDDEIVRLFLPNLKKVMPEFGEKDVLHSAVFRERYVQPFYFLEQLEFQPNSYTILPNIYFANSSFAGMVPLNNNSVLEIAQNAVAAIIKEKTNAQ